jgi:hypothetical protein
MGILEIHFHDAQFEWTLAPGTDEERSFSVGKSESGRRESDAARGSAGRKLRSVGLVALAVGAAVAVRRLRRQARADDESASKRRLRPLSR